MDSHEYGDNAQPDSIQHVEEPVVYPNKPQKRAFFSDRQKISIFVLNFTLVILLAIIIFFIFVQKKPNIASSVPDALSMYEDSYTKMRNNDASYQEICEQFEMAISTADNIGKFHYSVYYAKIIYDIEGDIEKAANQIKKYESIANTDSRLLDEYYAVLSDLYTKGGNLDQAEFYNQKLANLAPSDVIDIREDS